MAGKLTFNLDDFQKAAIKYRKQLLMIPIIGIQETLKFMTGRPGIRYMERVGTLTGGAELAPYNPAREQDAELHIDFRTLQTYFGSVIANFEPNSAISTILGVGAVKGDGQMKTPTAVDVLTLIARSVSEALNGAIWNGKRNESGTKTADLFNGFDTITDDEVTAGNIASAKGNYLKITEEVTSANAVDIAKEILHSLDPRLRAQKNYLYCSQDFLDKYNEGYLLTHGGIPYNREYGQTAVEGSDGKLIFAPLSNKAGSKYLHVAPQSNMLVGYDQMGDVESILVKEYKPFVLSYISTMFFGTQFESIDKSRLMVAEIANV